MPLYELFQDKGNPALRGPEDIVNRLGFDRFKYFTILVNDNIVGGVLFRTKGSGPFFAELRSGEYYLQRLYISPEYQNMKIGRTAIKLCESQFENATRFYVDFPDELDQNRNCYESIGYKDTGVIKEVEPGLVLASYIKNVPKLVKI